jgi:hypothetical protein
MKKVILIILLGMTICSLLPAENPPPGMGTSTWNDALQKRYPKDSQWVNATIFALFAYVNAFGTNILKWARYLSYIMLTLDLMILGFFLAFGMVDLKKELVMRIIKVMAISSCIVWYPGIMNFMVAIATQIALLPDGEIAAKVTWAASEQLGYYQLQLERAEKAKKNWLGVAKQMIKNSDADMDNDAPLDALEIERIRKTIRYLEAFKDIEGRTPKYFNTMIENVPVPNWMIKPLQTRGGAVYADPEYVLFWGALAFQPIKDDLDRTKVSIGKALVLGLVYILGMICLVICVAQYLMTIMEFAILTAVGSLCLPLGYFKLTQFAVEKLIGTVFAFTMKIIVATMMMQLIVYAYVGLVTTDWISSTDQIMKFLFTSLFCVILSMTIPNMIASFLSGTPSLGFSNVMNVAHAVTEVAQSVFMLSQKHGGGGGGDKSNLIENRAMDNAIDKYRAKNSDPKEGDKAIASSNGNNQNNNVNGQSNVNASGSSSNSASSNVLSPSSELAGSLKGNDRAAALEQNIEQLLAGGSSPYNVAKVDGAAESGKKKVEEKSNKLGERK